ncbi:glycoside hydrolase [Paenibacillus psychroresistens]|uniref:Glycoside hydrolase n=1 Tax=Paenibacillus psychroresistens TaxID=1778678 RepID=A0A6B8REX3_9BACL|nr:glycoside hydrolase [Paenibacillus psychroresistens]QGQ94105.1 glycoside hydrolase [Paenibacillus psychroresistens]
MQETALKRKWKLFVIHHSHTDIGYTDRQEKIEKNHIDYIKQAVMIGESIRSGKKKEWQGFKWTCETFWAVERFLEQADMNTQQLFVDAVKSGDIELTASYLNLTELMDFEMLKTMMGKAVKYGESINVKVDTAMTADINGYSWGYAQCLKDLGIENLFSCIHTYHGMFPIGSKQIPFWWETPKGNKILVWNGDHYQLGNDLGLVPGALHSYNIKDEFQTTAYMPEHREIAEKRIHRYLSQLEQEDYPYDFVPVMASGLITDNAPPNGQIMDFIHKWNLHYGASVHIEMTTLNSFFTHLRKQEKNIPIFKGDWPDWWADGVASTPVPTKVFREAQRNLRVVKQLDPYNKVATIGLVKQAEYNLSMYAEHTWGHWASVMEPWDTTVQSLEFRKGMFAYQAHQIVSSCLDKILEAKGEVPLVADRPMNYQVINPHPFPITDMAKLNIDFWEVFLLGNGLQVIDLNTGKVVPHQLFRSVKCTQVCIIQHLEAGEERKLQILPVVAIKQFTVSNHQGIGADGINDISGAKEEINVNENSLETPFVCIAWKEKEGIVSWFDKKSGSELLRNDRIHNAFTPVYEITPFDGIDQACGTRIKMGRNRKRINVSRSIGTFSGVKLVEKGPLFTMVELHYELAGTTFYSVVLTAYAGLPRVDISVRMNKDNVWEPENIYLSLPFAAGDPMSSETWIEKTGAILRPRIDQLPGTGIDFYCIQEGIALSAKEQGLAIAIRDAPLIQLGPLEFGVRQLKAENGIYDDAGHLYSWVLNNFWDTNFKAALGGFYEFRYSLSWGGDIVLPEEAIRKCHAMNTEVICVRTT